MKLFFSSILIVFLSACASLSSSPSLKTKNLKEFSSCSFNRNNLLAQDLDTFDQSTSGVRSVYTQAPECKLAAAELISDYRARRPELSLDFNSYLLFWHEGQLRAEIGDYSSALPLLDRARMRAEVGPEVSSIWNFYVEATMAFVRRDKAALVTARQKLATVPANYLRGIKQVPNLKVVDALISCFDRSYADAYNICNTAKAK